MKVIFIATFCILGWANANHIPASAYTDVITLKQEEESKKLYKKRILLLTHTERQCIFGQIREKECTDIIKMLLNKTGKKENALGAILCREINNISNYMTLGNKNGFGKEGSIAFDGRLSIGTEIKDNGNCTIITGLYDIGYSTYYTQDLKSECIRNVSLLQEGRFLVKSANLVSCNQEIYNRTEPVIIKRNIGVLKIGKKENATYYLGEIYVPQR